MRSRKRVRGSLWTPKREERLKKYFKKYRKEDRPFRKISKHFTMFSRNAVYKKLGRMGYVECPWTITEKERKR